MVGHPTDDRFKQMVRSKSFTNCRVKVSDVTNAKTIFGPYLPCLEGETTRQKPERVDPEYTEIPRDFYELHKFVTLTDDVIFMNGVAFLTTLSQDIRLFTYEHVPSHTAKQLIRSLIFLCNCRRK